ncbi:MAG: AAA family ATPase [Chloroflexi bacterium]|nr:AAA family ATPase [Chloroflexota bacterium]
MQVNEPKRRRRATTRRSAAKHRRYLWPTALPGGNGNLPRELSSFIGRQEQLDGIAHKLRSLGLLTLVGPGGVGKTRLALRTAASLDQEYAHGTWLVELAPVADPAGVAAAVAAALGVRERPGWSVLATLKSVLRSRQLLLVLDNCEHVVQAAADLAASLLQSCHDVSVLATSRQPLGVSGEVLYQVPPLPVPARDEPFDQLVHSEAIELFAARVQAVDASFRLTPSTADLAGHICQRLGGLPLAIELAAARTSTLSLAELARRLEDPLSVLTLGARTAPTRQQTLRATIDWSYRLLTESEQKLLRRLAVFSGGCTATAAIAVCSDDDLPGATILDLLDRLVAQSLLMVNREQEELRFYLLETVRQYCRQLLDQAAETSGMLVRHCDWCLHLVSGSAPESLDPVHVARLGSEQENLRAALRWVIDSAQVRPAARIAVGMATFWLFRGSFAEGRAALTAVLDLAEAGPAPPELPNAGIWAASMAHNQGEYADAEELLLRALALAQADGNRHASAFAESQLARVAYLRGDLVWARQLFEHTLNEIADWRGPLQFIVQYELALTCIELGERSRARELLRAAMEDASPAQARFARARVLKANALLAEQESDYIQAEQLLVQSVAIERAIENQPGVIQSLTMQGAVAVQLEKHSFAATVLAEALELAAMYVSNMRLVPLLEAVGSLLLATQPDACVRLAAAAAQLRTTQAVLPLPSERRRLDDYLHKARRRLGEQAYADAWATGQTMTVEAMVYQARLLVQQPLRRPQPTVIVSSEDALSNREREVAMLVAQGLTNKQIAAELVVSPATVRSHVEHILTKLTYSSRVQIATWGLRHGLASFNRDLAL